MPMFAVLTASTTPWGVAVLIAIAVVEVPPVVTFRTNGDPPFSELEVESYPAEINLSAVASALTVIS